MTNQQRDIQTILVARITLIQSISAANCECLRLNQIASGLMILDQMDEDQGVADATRDIERTANDEAVARCRSRIEDLERQLAELDRELANTTGRNRK